MKRLNLIFLLAICISCTKSRDETAQEEFNFSYRIDTVLVDSGEDFIYLRRGLGLGALSPDKKQLYNFNPDVPRLEVIDLEQMKLVDQKPMDLEGPLGTGFPRALKISEDGKFFFVGFTDFREFDPTLQERKLYRFRTEKPEGLEENEALGEEFFISNNGNQVFAPYGPENGEEPKTGMAMITLEDLSLKKFPFDLWQRTQNYIASLYIDGKLQSRSFEQVDVYPMESQVLVSSHNFNEVYLLDLESDSVIHKTYHSELTADTKKVPGRTTLDAPEQMREVFTQMNEEVDFSNFYFDEQNQKFFRFSRELDRKIGDSTVHKQILTIFDQDLNQLHEENFPIDYFGLKFFKDGKLWSFVNVDDELGFIIFTFDY
ncbi:DUF4221 family protein [Algoriphagus halophilus]|uniref:DUF4221 domain-containing protein n=1 Tax=Algoriphagus halophilus TaxID=226505 RepID=A0A1N6GFC1_9BACT|nr:DUF4221 family protein [Algoriphagus halophilus]SIO06248.1 protein of unknown function [Algoriphagus halophilus]